MARATNPRAELPWVREREQVEDEDAKERLEDDGRHLPVQVGPFRWAMVNFGAGGAKRA